MKKYYQYFPVGRLNVSSLSYARDKTKNIFFSSSVTCSIFTILVIPFSSSIMPIFEKDNRYGKNRKLDCMKLFKINVRLQMHSYS